MAKKKKIEDEIDYDELLANESIEEIEISNELEDSFLKYSLSVIEERAIPDCRDGLKPVQRKILYSMYDQKLFPDKEFKKCARTVGDVIGRFSAHGDQGTYGAMVNLTSEYSARYPTICGHGNFGSLDGDSAASMRYTEAKLSKLALAMLNDLDKNAVDMKLNFSEDEYEPVVLPALLPNLLVNSSYGIAVGFTTNMPPHNLNNVCDTIKAYIKKNGDITIKQLVTKYLLGPDYQGGSYLLKDENILKLYETGTGALQFKAKITVEEKKNGTYVVIHELPPDVNKPKLMETLHTLCIENKKIPNVVDVLDKSEKNYVEIVLKLHKSAIPDLVIKELYNQTPLQKSKSYIFRALVDQTPTVLNLTDIIEHYLAHRKDVIIRRTQFAADKLNARLHILEGFSKVSEEIKKVVNLITDSESREDASQKLQEKYKLSEIQAKAILDKQIGSLTKVEKNKVLEDIKVLTQELNDNMNIIQSEDRINDIIVDELTKLQKEFGDERRTEIIEAGEIAIDEEKISNDPMMVVVTNKNEIKHMPYEIFEEIMRGKSLKEKNKVFKQGIKCTMADNFIVILENGEYVKLSFVDLNSFTSKIRIVRVVNIVENTTIVGITERGLIKKTEVGSFRAKLNKQTLWFNCVNDRILDIRVLIENDNNIVTLCTENGLVHRFYMKSFSSTAMGGKGVGCINLEPGEKVKDFDISNMEEDSKYKLILFTKSENGNLGYKTLLLTDFMIKGRMSKGVSAITFSKKDLGNVIYMMLCKNDFYYIDNNGNLIPQKLDALEATKKTSKPEEFKHELITTKFFI